MCFGDIDLVSGSYYSKWKHFFKSIFIFIFRLSIRFTFWKIRHKKWFIWYRMILFLTSNLYEFFSEKLLSQDYAKKKRIEILCTNWKYHIKSCLKSHSFVFCIKTIILFLLNLGRDGCRMYLFGHFKLKFKDVVEEETFELYYLVSYYFDWTFVKEMLKFVTKIQDNTTYDLAKIKYCKGDIVSIYSTAKTKQ